MCWRLPIAIVNASVSGVINLKVAAKLPRGLASVHPFRTSWVPNLVSDHRL